MDVGGGMARSAMAPDALRDADVYLSRRGTGRPIGASRTIVFGQESLCQIRTVRARVILTYLLRGARAGPRAFYSVAL